MGAYIPTTAGRGPPDFAYGASDGAARRRPDLREAAAVGRADDPGPDRTRGRKRRPAGVSRVPTATMTGSTRSSPMRSFDADRLGGAEAGAWVAYYQRRWGAFLRSAVEMVRVGFALGPSRSLRGAWYVLKANQLWAPFPDNDAD